MSEDEVTDRVNATKYYIKNYYDQLYNGIQQREMRRQELEDAISQSQLTEDERDRLLNVYLEKESEYMRLKRKKMTIADFKTLKVIGKGSFGEVRLVKDKETDEVFALKKMSKTAMVEQKQINNIRNERDIMTEFNDNPWVVTLYYSFQDTEFLYFVMAYYPGGDLWNLLQNTGLSEDEIRFYLAEIVLSIDSIHQMEYFHRDLKPENILFDQEGHIKLADFGLCKPIGEQHEPLINSLKDKEAREKVAKAHENTSTKYKIDTWRKQRKELAFSVVGTPGYAAPEVMYETGYGKECDWWSLGVMFFEMLFGYHPFHADSIEELCINVLNWQSTLKFPSDIDVSDEAKDMLSGLICDAKDRLTIDQIKEHPFFEGVPWDEIRYLEPPFIPRVQNITDTTYFGEFADEEIEDDFVEEENSTPRYKNLDKDQMAWVGFTYKRFDAVMDKQLRVDRDE